MVLRSTFPASGCPKELRCWNKLTSKPQYKFNRVEVWLSFKFSIRKTTFWRFCGQEPQMRETTSSIYRIRRDPNYLSNRHFNQLSFTFCLACFFLHVFVSWKC